ncbi:hypothetical protein RB195_009647 [Necator americanus]|uniref:Uncharacterized protein n=1 Tax=Necator americanus TaxID=51031 RepID=A0ABR1CWP8_NECAM
MDAFDIYWREHKGDDVEPTATATIFALDDLIRKETELADMIGTTASASTTPQYNPKTPWMSRWMPHPSEPCPHTTAYVRRLITTIHCCGYHKRTTPQGRATYLRRGFLHL